MADRFEPDDPLATPPEPEYWELVDPDPPPPTVTGPSTFGEMLSGQRGIVPRSIWTPGTARWRRGVGVLIGVLIAVPVVVYAVWLFVNIVS